MLERAYLRWGFAFVGVLLLTLACTAGPRADGVAVLWLGNAVALSAMLGVKGRIAWATLACAVLGAFAAHLLRGDALVAAAALSLSNGVGVLVCRGVLLWLRPRGLDPSRPGTVGVICFGAGVGCAVGALLGVLTLRWLGRGGDLERFLIWWMADGLGVVLLTPTLLVLQRARRYAAQFAVTPLGALAAVGLLAAMAVYLAQSRYPLAFIVPPLLLLMASELGLLGAAVGVGLMACAALGRAVLLGFPIQRLGLSTGEAVALAQAMLAVSAVSAFAAAAARTQRQRLKRHLYSARDRARREAARSAALERQHAESEARFRRIAESTSDAILQVDGRGVCVYASPSAARVSGYAAEALVGRTLRPLVHPDDIEAISAALDGAGPREDAPVQFRWLDPTGAWRWLEGNPRRLVGPDGTHVGSIDVVRDIGVRKAMEAELVQARAEAEAAAAVKSDFLANMSHELRTPLTAVLGFAELLQQQPELGPTARRCADRIGGAGLALMTLVNDILDFSKLEAGKVAISPLRTDIAALIADAAGLFSLQAAEKGLDLQVLAAELPDCVLVDPGRVRQVLLNLIGNAVKFTGAGSVRVEASWRDGRLAVAVADTGPGIPADQAERLFQRFSQVDGSATRAHGGAGLGLAICRGLVEAMGGEIGVTSVPGQGATFHFGIAAPASEAEPSLPAEGVPAFDAAGVRMLVVDDQPANRELVRALMEPFGAVVSEAADGASAVALAEQAPFDLILMDVCMPGLGGPEAARAIREGGGANQAIPIVAFSAAGEELLARNPSAFDDVLAKPVEVAALLATVARWTGPDAYGEDADVAVA